MKKHKLAELLALHAEGLNAGHDRTVEFMRRSGVDSEAAALFLLAGRLKAAMLPVEPRIGFREQLYRELMQEQVAVSASGPVGRKMWVGAATIGSLLSLAGLFLWMRRHRGEPAFVELSAS